MSQPTARSLSEVRLRLGPLTSGSSAPGPVDRPYPRAVTTVLLVCGSLQSTSANRAALDVVEARLSRTAGVQVSWDEELRSIPAFDPDLMAAPGAAVERFRDRLRHCDAVVFAAPEYAGGLAGALKNALDWIVGSGELYSKPVAVCSAGTSGGANARRDLVQTLTWQGAHVIAELGISAPRTKADDAGRYTDTTTIRQIDQLVEVAVAAPALAGEARLDLVRAVAARLGIDPGHIAPVTELDR